MPRRVTPENAVKKAVLDLLAAEHVFAFRLNTAAFRGENEQGKKRFFKAHSLGRGAADILALPHLPTGAGISVRPAPLWIEGKGPHGKTSSEQESFARHVLAEGHFYLVAQSSDDVLKWLRAHGVSR